MPDPLIATLSLIALTFTFAGISAHAANSGPFFPGNPSIAAIHCAIRIFIFIPLSVSGYVIAPLPVAFAPLVRHRATFGPPIPLRHIQAFINASAVYAARPLPAAADPLPFADPSGAVYRRIPRSFAGLAGAGRQFQAIHRRHRAPAPLPLLRALQFRSIFDQVITPIAL